jgi:hypothetical protein
MVRGEGIRVSGEVTQVGVPKRILNGLLLDQGVVRDDVLLERTALGDQLAIIIERNACIYPISKDHAVGKGDNTV